MRTYIFQSGTGTGTVLWSNEKVVRTIPLLQINKWQCIVLRTYGKYWIELNTFFQNFTMRMGSTLQKYTPTGIVPVLSTIFFKFHNLFEYESNSWSIIITCSIWGTIHLFKNYSREHVSYYINILLKFYITWAVTKQYWRFKKI